jgi:hemoglobin
MSTLHVVSPKPNPHLELLGGPDAVVRLVDAFYGAMDQRPDARVLRAMHASDLTETKAVLVLYLIEWLGGAKNYSASRGAPRLGRIHKPFHIDSAARQAWMACMDEALGAVCHDDGLRHDLRHAFGKLATHLQNQHEPAGTAEAVPHAVLTSGLASAPAQPSAGVSFRTSPHPWRSR